MRETRDRSFKAKLFLLLQIGTEVTITNGTRWSSQARARLSGESDPSKVNRGGPDCLRMCTVSQTTETEDLEVEVQVSLMVAAVAAVTIGGLFTCSSHGLCHRVICVLRRCLCLETLWAITDSRPRGRREQAWERGCGLESNLGYSAHTAAVRPTWKRIYVHLHQRSIMRWLAVATSGSRSH